MDIKQYIRLGKALIIYVKRAISIFNKIELYIDSYRKNDEKLIKTIVFGHDVLYPP